MAWYRNLRLTPKLICSCALIAVLAVATGAIGLAGLHSVSNQVTMMTKTNTPAFVNVTTAEGDLNAAIRNTQSALLSPDRARAAQFVVSARAARDDVLAQTQQFQALPDINPQGIAAGKQWLVLDQAWMPLNAQIEQDARLHTPSSIQAGLNLSVGAEAKAAAALTQILTVLRGAGDTAVADSSSQSNAALNSATVELVAMMVAAIVMAVGLGWFIARSLARPLGELKDTASGIMQDAMTILLGGITALSRNDLTHAYRVGTLKEPRLTYVGKDELGQATQAVQVVVGQIAKALRGYEQARVTLGQMVHHVRDASQQVNSASQQLAQASQQVGEASQQISRSIEDVARGTSEQSKDSASAIMQMASLSTAVQQVAGGATTQSEAVGQANAAVRQLRDALEDTSRSVQAVTSAAGRAAGTAKSGGRAVAQTISSIDSVRAAVQHSADQVTALGKQSQEIGQIVEAIDDIAAQTNLLALNAAIEAARAGEHGKGFTVVAAEVRKLAERSSNETKEITQRIAAIQQQVAEVVRAMAAGSNEVEKSAMLGQQASEALTGILGVVEETNAQASSITGAVGRMTTSLAALSTAAERVATIATETAHAAGEMQHGATEVQTAMESIAAVSEQAAAGAEEVSASTEEQTASVEEMNAGAQELAALATGLQELVAQFTVEMTTSVQAGTANQVRPMRVA